jgi:hypothetical protein
VRCSKHPPPPLPAPCCRSLCRTTRLPML